MSRSDLEPGPQDEARMELRVRSVSWSAEGILLFDLRPLQEGALPPFSAGAHVDVCMQGGIRRSYSLLNDCAERHRYVIGVQKEAQGRGGSRWMHEALQAGTTVTVCGPRNHFPLDESAPFSVFIAGGIGITPIWSMIQRLRSLGRPWALHYSTRSRAATALLEEVAAAGSAGRVELNFNDVSGRHLDIAGIVGSAPQGAHFYCCGPLPMMKAFEEACSAVESERVHLEYFAAAAPPAAEGGFTVVLARQGAQVAVAPGQTILDALQVAGIAVPSSCQQGVCGICETKVLAGLPDHRDLVLSAAEKASNETMMICCSGARTSELTLDL